MNIAPTDPTAALQPAGTSSSLSQLSEDYTQFLTLLTAQISNQDPLKPMDSTEFVSQLAQLSQVEQAVVTNDNLDVLSSQIAALSVVSGPNMLGRTVTVPSNLIDLSDGAGDTFYELPADANNVSAEIRDPTGFLVRTMTGLPANGGVEVPLNWDGTNDLGQPVLEGNYTVEIAATDSAGNPLPVFTYRDADVTELYFFSGEVAYQLSGGEIVPAAAIISIQ